jgi:hypothetical protein
MPRLTVVLVASDIPPAPDWVGRQLADGRIDLLERPCADPAEVAGHPP